MADYKIVVEAAAERDLDEIFDYICNVLHEPDAAKRLYGELKENILSLGQMPERHPYIQEEPYKMLEIRQIVVENYLCFYKVEETGRMVKILRILYNRREWQKFI